MCAWDARETRPYAPRDLVLLLAHLPRENEVEGGPYPDDGGELPDVVPGKSNGGPESVGPDQELEAQRQGVPEPDAHEEHLAVMAPPGQRADESEPDRLNDAVHDDERRHDSRSGGDLLRRDLQSGTHEHLSQ